MTSVEEKAGRSYIERGSCANCSKYTGLFSVKGRQDGEREQLAAMRRQPGHELVTRLADYRPAAGVSTALAGAL